MRIRLAPLDTVSLGIVPQPDHVQMGPTVVAFTAKSIILSTFYISARIRGLDKTIGCEADFLSQPHCLQ